MKSSLLSITSAFTGVGSWVGVGGCGRCASVLGADLVGRCGGVGVPATAA